MVCIQITLECTEQRGTGTKGISRYTTEKNRRKTPDRIELMKYNKFLGRHTLHREIKAKKVRFALPFLSTLAR